MEKRIVIIPGLCYDGGEKKTKESGASAAERYFSMDHPFRNAAIGGFNRQDVLTYLEEQARQTSQERETLKKQLEETQSQRDTLCREGEDLRQRLARAQGELDAAVQERDSLSARLERANLDLSTARTQASREAQALEREKEEKRLLLDKLAALEPDAQAYTELKERAAGVELEAHRRAQAIQERAEEDAWKVRKQMEQWLQRVGREYQGLRAQLENTVAHAAGELEKAGDCLDRLNRLMEDQAGALEGVEAAYDATGPARVAAPMPIEEE